MLAGNHDVDWIITETDEYRSWTDRKLTCEYRLKSSSLSQLLMNACKKAANSFARKTIKSKRIWPFTIYKAGREKDTPIGHTACRSTR